MSYYRTCPDCGAHLDPGERCDCKDEKDRPMLPASNGPRCRGLIPIYTSIIARKPDEFNKKMAVIL